MKLSFVVVAFENPRALRTCLSSLLDQTEQDFEIIVCDNSIDEDIASDIDCLCSQLGHRIHYEWTADRTILTDPVCRHSRCLYTATEIGAGWATGDFLCFPNADSYYAPVFAERMLSAAAATSCDLVYCDFVHGLPKCKYLVMESVCCPGRVDKTTFILRRSLFAGFPDKRASYELADGLLIDRLVRDGISRKRVAEVLCVHN